MSFCAGASSPPTYNLDWPSTNVLVEGFKNAMEDELQERAERVRQQIADWVITFRQPAWIAHSEPGDGGPLASKYAGVPWLAEGEEWPLCGSCQRPMELFLQINLADLPPEAQTLYGTGLLQLFYCLNVEMSGEERCRCEGFEHFAKCHLTRIVQPTGPHSTAPNPEGVGRFEPKTIARWEIVDDFPHSEDLRFLLGLQINDIMPARETIQVDCPDAGVVAEQFPRELKSSFYDFEEEELQPSSEEKLGGWPWWLQSEDYAYCPTCGERMRLVFQTWADLAYLEPVQRGTRLREHFELGDAGIGCILQCPTHKDVLTFGWQCH